jgi:hypothetical protein
MTEVLALFALVCLCWSAVGAAFCVGAPRALANARPPQWLPPRATLFATVLTVMSIVLAIAQFGKAAGLFIVASAWMVAGAAFVPLINSRPAATMRITLWAAPVGISVGCGVLLWQFA